MSQDVKIDRSLVFNQRAKTYIRAQNKSGGNLARGSVVIWSTANTTATNPCFTTTTSADDKLVMGMLDEAIASNAYGRVQVEGLTSVLKVNGTTDIAVGDLLSSYTSAGIGQKATTGKGGVLGIALEAYTTDDSNGVIDAYLVRAPRVDGSTATVTLDAAYDGAAGSGAGRTVTVDNAAIVFAGSASATDVLQITNATGSGALIDLAQSGTGMDVEGTSDTWTVTKTGVGTFASLVVPAIVSGATGDVNLAIDAYGSGTIGIGATSTGAITLTRATTLSNGATITAGGLTVSAGTTSAITSTNIGLTGVVTITGNTAITGTLTVSGALTWGGDLTTAGTLTVDELILDTDGVAPATTSAYVVRVGSNLILNAPTLYEVQLHIAGSSEFEVSGSAVDIKANSLLLDTDGNTYLDNATDNTIKIYVAGAQDFTIAANLLSVLSGSVLNINDDTLFQVGTTGDGVLWHTAAGIAANTAVTGVLIGTPVNYASAANSTIISNITASGDIQMAVNKGGHSQTVLFADSSAGNVYVNAASAGSVYVDVANTTEYTFDASNFTVANGNKVKFAGNDGILDSGGNELILFTATGTAVNYLQVINAATANPITLQCLGTDDKGIDFEAVNNEEMLTLSAISAATDYVDIKSGDGTTEPTISTAGDSTDVGIVLNTKGAGYFTIALGGVETLQVHDAAAMVFAGAADVAGHAAYLQTEDGGAASSNNNGVAGALVHISTGDGSVPAGTGTTGGAGGALSVVSGAGAAGSATGTGGAGGAIAITAGVGGATSGAGTGGAGASITLTAGAGGATTAGTNGAPGAVSIGAGVFKMKIQTIDMADATITLTLVPGTPAGTLMTGNLLEVDANSGTNENLLLPPEGDCTGILLVVQNTGGETINIQNDAAGALLTCATNECATLTCDGTTWRGFVGVL